MKDWAIECLKKTKIGRDKRRGRKETTLRVIELCSAFNQFPTRDDSGRVRFHLDSVKVEEYEVRAVDSSEGP